METYKELLGAAIKFKNTAYINRVCTKSASKDSRSACPQYVFPDMCSSLHQLEQGFFTKSVSVQYLYKTGHTYTEQDIQSRTPGYTQQGIRSRTPSYTEQGIWSRIFKVGPKNSIQMQCLPLFEVGHLRQLCFISDSSEKWKHAY